MMHGDSTCPGTQTLHAINVVTAVSSALMMLQCFQGLMGISMHRGDGGPGAGSHGGPKGITNTASLTASECSSLDCEIQPGAAHTPGVCISNC